MEDHIMTQGLIPIKHSSLPGLVKLPKRYLSSEGNISSNEGRPNHPTVNLRASPLSSTESVSNRLADLIKATSWIRQELIGLRQHDILLKRQFFNIHHSIQSLEVSKPLSRIWSPVTESPEISFSAVDKDTPNTTNPLEDTSSILALPSSFRSVGPVHLLGASHPDVSCSQTSVVPELSPVVKLVADDSDDSDDDDNGDTFIESDFFRLRSMSMGTSRDLAVQARRRDSKDLI